jgi:hypothetical protein
VPLAGPEEVFRAVASVLPGHLRRITDGETGPRKNWVGGQFPVLAGIPQLEQTESDPAEYGPPVALRLRAGVDPGEVTVPALGYAAAAKASFAEFRQLKEWEIIPQGWRFQVSLPTPLATVVVLLEYGSRAAFEPLYRAAIQRELTEILATLPHEELTVQWDVCQEVGLWEGFYKPHGDGVADARAAVTEELGRLARSVPSPVELGFHLCYGDYDHTHFMAPRDLRALVTIANAIEQAARRPVDYVHMPVPREREDDDYFAPLAHLELSPATALYLGLIHATDGAEGARRRIAAAHRHVEEFGVATECGLGRRPPIQVGRLLQIHREVAAEVASAPGA